MTDWISAKKPPEKSGRYIVAEDGWMVKDAHWDGEHWLRGTSLYVTHWMPLPDHPDFDSHDASGIGFRVPGGT